MLKYVYSILLFFLLFIYLGCESESDLITAEKTLPDYLEESVKPVSFKINGSDVQLETANGYPTCIDILTLEHYLPSDNSYINYTVTIDIPWDGETTRLNVNSDSCSLFYIYMTDDIWQDPVYVIDDENVTWDDIEFIYDESSNDYIRCQFSWRYWENDGEKLVNSIMWQSFTAFLTLKYISKEDENDTLYTRRCEISVSKS